MKDLEFFGACYFLLAVFVVAILINKNKSE
jgi:hypothetical protein